MNVRTLMANAVFLVLPALLAACSDASRPPAVSFKIQNVPPVPRTMSQMSREVHISRDFMSPRSRARRASHSMHPRFINHPQHGQPHGRRRGACPCAGKWGQGFPELAFTVDQYRAIQHIPLNETGRHADRGGPGDMYSIGIEMGEVRSHNPIVTWNRSAKLTAVLMKQYNIPLRNVVPHYYWTARTARPSC